MPESLHSIATKDVATPEIQYSLLSAEELGQSKLDTFVEERLVNSTVKFRDRLQKSNPLTFKSLYEVSNRDAKGKVTTLKADRTILQRLVTAFQAGRKVDLHHVLHHELMNIPISIANCETVVCELVQKLSFQMLSPEMVFVQQKSRLTSRILALSSMAKHCKQ